MRKPWPIVSYILLFCIIAPVSTAALGTALLKQPFLMAPIRSNSMYPLLERGDAVIIRPVEPGQVALEDVIVFRPEGGSLGVHGWVMHRVVGGNIKEGFITKGDANEYTDQEHGDIKLVQSDAIVASAVTISGRPLRIRLLGYPSLWLEQYSSSPYALPGCLGIVALMLMGTELKLRNKRTKKNKSTPAFIMYPAAGLVVCLLFGTTQIAASSFLTLVYEVSPSGRGIITGSPVGMLQQGDVITKDLSEVKGNGFIPMVVSVTSSDAQFSFNNNLLITKTGAGEKLTVTIKAAQPGKYESKITIGVFLPTLPPVLIHQLAQSSYWLALWATSMVPALPLLLWPTVDPRLRRLAARSARRSIFRVTQKIHL